MDNNYSLSDMAAVTGGAGGNSFIWLFALLVLLGGNGWNRNGNGDFNNAAQQEILFGQRFSNLDNKIDRIGNGIADATFAINNSIKDGNTMVAGRVVDEGRATQAQLAQGFADVQATTVNQTQKILDAIAQSKIDALQGRINQLELQNAVAGVVRYPNGMTYNAGMSPFCNCGTGYCN